MTLQEKITQILKNPLAFKALTAYFTLTQATMLLQQHMLMQQQNKMLEEKQDKEDIGLVKEALDTASDYNNRCVFKRRLRDDVSNTGILKSAWWVLAGKPVDNVDHDCQITLRKMMLFSDKIKNNHRASQMVHSVNAYDLLVTNVDKEKEQITVKPL